MQEQENAQETGGNESEQATYREAPLSEQEQATTPTPSDVIDGEVVTNIVISSNIPDDAPARPRWEIWARRAFFAVWVLLTLLLISILVLEHLAEIVPLFTGPLATVTIYPKQVDYSAAYTLSGKQVGSRLLVVTTQAQTKSVPTTGIGYIPATEATGTITLYNAATYPQVIRAGTDITGADGVEAVTDSSVYVPSGNPPVFGIASVAAHTVQAGLGANIAALDVDTLCCVSGISAKNLNAFTGGKNAQPYPMVSKQDISHAASQLESSLTNEAQAEIATRLSPSEQLANSVQCAPAIAANPKEGSKATRVTVSVQATCHAEVYNQDETRQLAAHLLMDGAAKAIGVGYKLTGNIAVSIEHMSVVRDSNIAHVVTRGMWVYQFSPNELHALSVQVAGKHRHEAQSLLLHTQGIGGAAIDTAGNSDTLPTNPNQIAVKVLTILV